MRNVSLDPPSGPEYACLIISNREITCKETVSLRANVKEDEVDEYCADHHDIKSRDLVDHALTALSVPWEPPAWMFVVAANGHVEGLPLGRVDAIAAPIP